MKPDTKILCRVGDKLRDYKVIEVWQWTADRTEEKADRYIRADIVEKIIDAYADVRVDNTYDTGGHYGDLTHEEELQLEKNRIFGIYGLNK